MKEGARLIPVSEATVVASYIGYIHIFTTFEAIIKLNDYAI